MTRKHFKHAAQYIAYYSEPESVVRAAMTLVCVNLFSTFGKTFDSIRFQEAIDTWSTRYRATDPAA